MNTYLIAAYCFAFIAIILNLLKITVDYRKNRAKKEKK